MQHSNRCRVPASSVGFGAGEWMVTARQSLGKGAVAGDEARRGRKTLPEILNSSFVIGSLPDFGGLSTFDIRRSIFDILLII